MIRRIRRKSSTRQLLSESCRRTVRRSERHRRRDDRAPPREADARRAAGSGRVPARRPRRAQGDPRDHRRLAAVRPNRRSRAAAQVSGSHRAARSASIRAPAGSTTKRTADGTGSEHDSATTTGAAWRRSTTSSEFRDLLDEANRANASFYPVDPRGLAVFDTPIMRTDVPGPPPPMTPLAVDRAMLSGRARRRCARSPKPPTASPSSTATTSPAGCSASSTI